VRRDPHTALEPLLNACLGADTLLHIETAHIGEIRLEGNCDAKPTEVKEIVSASLAEVIANPSQVFALHSTRAHFIGSGRPWPFTHSEIGVPGWTTIAGVA
jgi:hypothetical protein